MVYVFYDIGIFTPTHSFFQNMPPDSTPRYNGPGVRYNSGLRYKAAPGTITTNQKRKMASFKLNINRKNPLQVIALATLVTDKLAPAAPATPPIAGVADEVAAVVAKQAIAVAANNAYEAAKMALVELKTARDNRTDELRASISTLAKAVEVKTGGVEEEMMKSGIEIAAGKTVLSGPPDRVMNLNITAADQDGALDGSHDPVDHVLTYEVQLTTVDDMTGPYTTVLKPSSSSWKLTGLTSGQRVWVRVRATSSQGDGPWSDPMSKIVP